MSDVAIEDKRFCLVHGFVHPDDFTIPGDDLWCVEVEQPNVVTLDPSEYEVVSTRKSRVTHWLTAGDLAYLDVFGQRLVLCSILSITYAETVVRVNAKRDSYPRGERIILATPNRWLIHRDQVSNPRGAYRVSGVTGFVDDNGGVIQ